MRSGLLALIFLLLGTLTLKAQEPDWRFWQNQFEKTQAEKGKTLQAPGIKEVQVTATLPDYPEVPVSRYRNQTTERCITCHDGISPVSPSHPATFGCTVCHGGDGGSVEKKTAHASLIYDPEAGTGRRNPSSLAVVKKSCGQAYCHSGHQRPDRNHIGRVNKSMMATLAGMISGLRYQWAAQSTPLGKYAVRAVKDEDGEVPEDAGGLRALEALPFFSPRQFPESKGRFRVSHHIGDHLLRKNCFQCHIDSKPGPDSYRSQGCAACHFTYAADGRYKGDDPTISRTEPGHPAAHKMTALTPDTLCRQCHLSPTDPENKSAATQDAFTFPGTGQIEADAHTSRGFACIDCHTQFDIMGDGNLYSKQHQAVEIRCETCHGDGDSPPAFEKVTDPSDRVIRLSRHYPWSNGLKDTMPLTSRKNKMTNVKLEKGTLWTLGKINGKKFRTPTIHNSKKAHLIPAHKKKLECTACHSQWVPECNGCHSVLDQSRSAAAGNKAKPDSAKAAAWALNAGLPRLMVGPRGKAAPMLPQPQQTLTVLDEKGIPITALGKYGQPLGPYRDWVFTNPHGYSGANLAYALNPHSVGKQVRSCASCHLSPETLGLGEGDLDIQRRASGENDRMVPLNRSGQVRRNSEFAPGAKISVRGEPLAGSSQPGARPFNQKEINRILKVGNCIPCHDGYDDKIYQDIEKSYRFENKLAHRKLRQKFLNKR